MKVARIEKDKSTPEKEAFWNSAEQAMTEISEWPDWKQSYLSPLLFSEVIGKKIIVVAAPVNNSRNKK